MFVCVVGCFEFVCSFGEWRRKRTATAGGRSISGEKRLELEKGNTHGWLAL